MSGNVILSIPKESALHSHVLDWIKILLENISKTKNTATTAHYYYPSHISLSAHILTQSCHLSTIYEKLRYLIL